MALAIGMVLLGAIAIGQLPIEQYPDITPPVVEVSAAYQGADAQTVDNAVATPIAQSIMGVSDMLYMQATSANDGSMNLQVTFDIGSDPDLDAIFTQNNVAVSQAQLPASVVQQGVTTRKSMTGFLIVYSLHSDGRYDGDFLANYAYINIENELLKIDGVGKVNIMGAGEYAMRIWLHPDRMEYYGISLDEVTAAVRAQGGIFPAGQFGAEPSDARVAFTYTVTMPPQIEDADQFGRILLKTTSDGEQVRLSDVADVALGNRSYGMQSAFGKDPTALIVVYQQPGSNAVEVGSRVKAEMERLAERFPDGVTYTSMVDATTSIRAGVEDIVVTLLVAFVLVILIIYLFLQDWRSTLIPLLAIPVSLIGAFALFPLFGFTLNIISLLGMVLAIGLVVDDAIVVVEAVQVNIERGMAPAEATVEAMRSIASPIVATSLVLLAVFVPVSFLGSITGRLFQQFSITIATTVALSTINALTLSPALCALLLRPQQRLQRGFFARFNRWFERRMEGYTRLTDRFVRRIGRTVLLTCVVLGAIALIWRWLPSGFLPDEDQGYLMVFVQTPDATSLPVTVEAMQRVDRLVRGNANVEATSYAAGFNMLAGIAATNSGIIFVKLIDYKDRKMTSSELTTQLTSELYAAIPEAECYAFIPPAIPGLGVTSGITFEVQDLQGRGTEYLSAQAMRLMDSLRQVPGVASVSSPFDAGVPQRRIEVDKERALALGVSLDDFYRTMNALLGGTYINNFNRFGQLYQTWVQAAPEYRRDRYSLDSYFVTNAAGESIPVSSFASVRDTVGVAFVSQFNLYRSIGVTLTPDAGTSTATAMANIERVAAEVLPDDVAITWSGLSYQEATASRSSAVVYLLSLLIVFLVLAALYNSWGLPLAILLAVPLAVLGALAFVGVAHWIDPLFINNVYMQISLVMLIGMAAKNAILVVEYADRLFFEEGRDLLQATIEAACIRLRPILMTAFAFILGVLPLVFASGVYATARNIMGVALVGGMLAATLLGIFLYPPLYYLIARLGHFERKRQLKQPAT